MSERLTFTLTGRDELSRVLNNTADASDRLRLRMAGITADADGQLRDLQGRFVSTDEAQRRLSDGTHRTRGDFNALGEAAGKLGEKLKASLISLAPAAIPATAALAGAAAEVGAQFGAAAVAAAAYGAALKPQLTEIKDAVDAQSKYEDAVRTSGATSQEAAKAQLAYQQQLDKMPAATQRAAVAVGLLRDNFQDWSDSLAGDVMGPFTKGIAVANELLPKTTGLVKGASGQFDRLISIVGGEVSTPGFDHLTEKFTAFANESLQRAISELTIFLAKVDTGKVGGGIQEFLDYARANGPAVEETLRHVGDALLNVLRAGSDVGVSMLDLVNALSGIIAAVPPGALAVFLQLAVAIKTIRLAAAGMGAARAAIAAFSTELTALRLASVGAGGGVAGLRAAIASLPTGAKIGAATAGIAALVLSLHELSSNKPAVQMDALSTSLGTLVTTGKLTGALKSNLDEMSASIAIVSKSASDNKLAQLTTDFGTWLGVANGPGISTARDNVDAWDKAMADAVKSGNVKLAASEYELLRKAWVAGGGDVNRLTKFTDDYHDALSGQALEQKLTAESMGLFGDQALAVQKKLDAQKSSADGLRQSIQALNDVNRAALSAEADMEQAIDDTAKAASKAGRALHYKGGELDLSTQKARDAYKPLADLAAKTDAATAAARDQGRSWEYVSGEYEKGRTALIKSAQQMGLTKTQAKQLADQILQTPDKTAYLKGDIQDLSKKISDAKAKLKHATPSQTAKIKGNIADLEKKLAAARRELNDIDGKTAKTYVLTVHKFVAIEGGVPVAKKDYAAGGRVRGYAGGGSIQAFPNGGFVQGPGTGTSDSIFALFGSGAMGRVSNTEFVVNARATSKYLPLLEAINSGRLPAGKPAARAGLPAAPVATAVAAGSNQPAVTYNVYPRASVIDARDLQLIQRQEEARQRVGRPR